MENKKEWTHSLISYVSKEKIEIEIETPLRMCILFEDEHESFFYCSTYKDKMPFLSF
jgi:hypothetical protein